MSGTASDSGLGNNGISSVTVNGVAANNGTASGSGTANWDQLVALSPGANTITVVAKDNSANQNSTTVQISVNYNQAPDSTIDSPATDVTIFAGQSVDFQGSGTDPDNNLPLSFSWDFGGGATNSSSQNPGLVTFDTEGVYIVTFTATDNLGLADPTPATRTITVNPPAPVVFVEPAGVCNGNTPCVTSMQEAIAIVAIGGTIKVAQGTYHENVIVSSSKNFTLEGGWDTSFLGRVTNPALTVIDGDVSGDGLGDGRVFEITASSGVNTTVKIERFTIQNGDDDDGGGIFASAYNTGSVDLNLSGNIIRNNKATNSGTGVGVAAHDSGSNAQATLTNNMIFGNDTAGDGGGLYVFSDNGSNVTVSLINNTLTDNVATGAGGGLRAYASNGGAANVAVKNSILWGNGAATGQDVAIGQASGGTATVNASYSDIGDVLPDVSTPGTYNDLGNNIDADPLFVNFPGGDLHLGSGSPALDIGTSTGAPAVDFEGDPRPQGAAHDLGADERLAGPLTISALSQPDGEVGVSYNSSFGVTGGRGPYSIAVTSGALPPGLALVGESITGIPTTNGRSRFTITVTDQLGASVSRRYTVTIYKPLIISTTSLPTGRVGRKYNATVKAANGKTPYTWSITSRVLPAGLLFDSTTGKISGTPLAAGSTVLTFQVTDLLGGQAVKVLTLTIN